MVKPTIGVFVVGGIDAVCNLMLVAFVKIFITPIFGFQVHQAILLPLFFLQLLNHSLSYGLWNKNI